MKGLCRRKLRKKLTKQRELQTEGSEQMKAHTTEAEKELTKPNEK